MNATPQTYRFTAPASPLTPKICRDTVAILVTATGHTPHLADTARILVSEVVTNAVLHTATPTLHLEAAVTADGVRVSVYDDESAAFPAPPQPAPGDENGRGLLLVQAMAQTWGTGAAHDPARPGKHIWFQLSDEPAAQ